MKTAPHKGFSLPTLPSSEVCASPQQPQVGYRDPMGCAFVSSIAEILNSKQQRSWASPKSLNNVVLEEGMLTSTRRKYRFHNSTRRHTGWDHCSDGDLSGRLKSRATYQRTRELSWSTYRPATNHRLCEDRLWPPTCLPGSHLGVLPLYYHRLVGGRQSSWTMFKQTAPKLTRTWTLYLLIWCCVMHYLFTWVFEIGLLSVSLQLQPTHSKSPASACLGLKVPPTTSNGPNLNNKILDIKPLSQWKGRWGSEFLEGKRSGLLLSEDT